MQYRSGREAFVDGVRMLAPLTPGVIPFGLVTGVMTIEMGMSPATAMGMTLIFYSGSAQMVALQLMSYLLSDQSFALWSLKFSSGETGRFAHYFYAGTAIVMWLTWQLSVLAGILLGASIPESWSLSFAIPLSFLALLVPNLRGAATLGAAAVGGLIAVLAVKMPYNLGLVMASIGGVIAGMLIEHFRNRASPNVQSADVEREAR
jgi:predicted branched-subunit amino acid permease